MRYSSMIVNNETGGFGRERQLFYMCPATISGSLVTAAWGVLRLRMEEKASRYGG
jgi:hypothetical protein